MAPFANVFSAIVIRACARELWNSAATAVGSHVLAGLA
jgi:hypothetical protein